MPRAEPRSARGSRRVGPRASHGIGCGTWDVGRGTWDVGRGTWDVGSRKMYNDHFTAGLKMEVRFGMWDVGCIRDVN